MMICNSHLSNNKFNVDELYINFVIILMMFALLLNLPDYEKYDEKYYCCII